MDGQLLKKIFWLMIGVCQKIDDIMNSEFTLTHAEKFYLKDIGVKYQLISEPAKIDGDWSYMVKEYVNKSYGK